MFEMLSQNLGLRTEVMQHHLGEKAETILYRFAAAPRQKGLVACFTSSMTSKRRQRRETQQWVRELAPQPVFQTNLCQSE
jgi:hypothetical protein